MRGANTETFLCQNLYQTRSLHFALRRFTKGLATQSMGVGSPLVKSVVFTKGLTRRDSCPQKHGHPSREAGNKIKTVVIATIRIL